MARIAHHPAAQRLGRRAGHFSKRLLERILDVFLPIPANLPPSAMSDVHRVLLVRPNFRIGNTLITSALILALRNRFPGAGLDVLTGDTTASLLEHLPVDEVLTISRRSITRPWRFAALFAHLRRRRYDVALEAGLGSFSGGLYTFLTGARFRLGSTGRGDRFLNVRLPVVAPEHVYDHPLAFARQLGVECPDHPVYAVDEAEAVQARAFLRDAGLARNDEAAPFAAVFVGGHQDKRWPAPEWLALARSLTDAGGRVAIFLGPEEMHFAERMTTELSGRATVIPPQPLRLFAALWSQASLIVTPDSGPMHLAAALGVPTIAVLQSEASLRYQPRRTGDMTLIRPTVADVAAAVLGHAAWQKVRRPTSASPPAPPAVSP